MKKNYLLSLSFIIICLLFTNLHAQPVMTAALQEVITGEKAEDFISVNIKLSDQYDDQLLYQQSRSIKDGNNRREFVVNQLKEFSRLQQQDLLSFLKENESAGKVKQITPLWIANVVNAQVKPEIINELMTRKDLSQLDYNPMQEVLIGGDRLSGSHEVNTLNSSTPSWSVDLIGAPRAWETGFRGEGVIVAVLDTGVNHNHQDLAGNMWEHEDYPNHGYSFVGNEHDILDEGGHGTAVAGIVAGTGAAGIGTGVAPLATIMNIQAMTPMGSASEAGFWAAIEFAVEHGANVLSISMGWPFQNNPDRATMRTVMNNTLNAGVIAAVAAGNEGTSLLPPPNEVRTPGDVPPPWLHPDQTYQGGISAVVSVGATFQDDEPTWFSSKGPVTWQNEAPFNDYPHNPGMGLIRPDIAAPGYEIITLEHNTSAGYLYTAGTSMSAPAVAGVMALMISKNPYITPEEISRILEQNAFPIAESKNNISGSGRLDAFAALRNTPHYGINYVSHSMVDNQGNDDGLINPGENITVTLSLENSTDYPMEDITAMISADSPFITFTDSVASFGNFEPWQTKELEVAFTFQVADNAHGNHNMEFTLDIFEDENPQKNWLNYFGSSVHGPYLEFDNLVIDDSEFGNNNQIIDRGEKAEVIITLTNTGQLPLENIQANLSTGCEWLSIISHDPVDIQMLDSGEELNLTFIVESSDLTPFQTVAELNFTAQSELLSFEQMKSTLMVNAPVYSGGDIPSTLNEDVTTSSMAVEPGYMTVSIPEGTLITGVDVKYNITSTSGAFMNEQRSFLRCVSPGGETESQVSLSSGSGAGTYQYHRQGLDIANHVNGGGDIEFELHVFRKWGGSGSNTQYTFVPDETWEIIVHFREAGSFDLLFNISDINGDEIQDVTIAFNNTTLNQGQYLIEGVPEGTYTYTVSAPGYQDASGQVTINNEDKVLNIVLNDYGTSVDNPESHQISIFPNPAREMVNINLNGFNDNGAAISLYNSTGQIIKSSKIASGSGKSEFNITGVNPGLYFIRIESGNIRITEPLIIH